MPLHLSWNSVQRTIQQATPAIEAWQPTVLVAISGGGSIPARILRSCLKNRTGRTLPIQTIGLVLYDDDHFKTYDSLKKTQWLDPSFDVQGQRLLLVDEVDDSRRTLSFAVAEMYRHFAAAEEQYNARRGPSDPAWVPPQLGTFVVHNKRRPKVSQLPEELMRSAYFVGMETEDSWHVYPWDAADIDVHNAMAEAQAHAANEAMVHKPMTFQESVAETYCSAYHNACKAFDEESAKATVPPATAAHAVATAAAPGSQHGGLASCNPATVLATAVPATAPFVGALHVSYESHLQQQYMAAVRGACVNGDATAPLAMKRVRSGCALAAGVASSPTAAANMMLM